jgi:hypothetical protein
MNPPPAVHLLWWVLSLLSCDFRRGGSEVQFAAGGDWEVVPGVLIVAPAGNQGPRFHKQRHPTANSGAMTVPVVVTPSPSSGADAANTSCLAAAAHQTLILR